MNKANLELLAPAGNEESLIAAVQNGADAVYLGGTQFNARRFAGNFDDDAFLRALRYCHARGVQVYVTFNTMLLERELPDALAYARFLYEAGADALIVQDMGLTRMLRAVLPSFPLHASTQMAVHDEPGLRHVEQTGFTRVVLARELSLDRIKALHAQSALPLECFAHGALCSAMSGACLFSSLAGGRSGNRGACAQPCRKPYTLVNGDDKAQYPLSLSDLSMLAYVGDLRAAGVSCIKLEGRMKRAEYVAGMVRAYRLAVDGAPGQDLQHYADLMRRVFERGTCTGYYYGADVKANAVGNQQNDVAALRTLQATYRGEHIHRPVRGLLALSLGMPSVLTLTMDGVRAEAVGPIAEPAKTEPDIARYIAQAAKFGDAPFLLEHCEVQMDAPAHLPVAGLNAMRREALAKLTEGTHPSPKAPDPFPVAPPLVHLSADGTRILAVVRDVRQAVSAFRGGAHFVALSPRRFSVLEADVNALQSHRGRQKLLLALPAADFEGTFAPEIQRLFDKGLLDGGVAQNASHAALIDGVKIAFYLANAANPQSVSALYEMGYDYVVASLELSKAQLRDLIVATGAGVYGYGRAQMMQLRHCPQRTMGSVCRHCPASLVDEKDRIFPLDIVSDEACCLTRVRNCEILDILDVLHTLPVPPLTALEFFDEGPSAVKERIEAAFYAYTKPPERLGATRGHFTRGVLF